MLKKSASSVLASLRGSTYRSVRLASSLAAALLDDLFEHPVKNRKGWEYEARGDGPEISHDRAGGVWKFRDG
jgi:hypothetical protein